jgi:2-hydroxychromene-2-carboxylate isomerase
MEGPPASAESVDLYFDFLSPFAYLATVVAPAVCARAGASVRFRPVLFAGLLNHWGQKGPAEIPPKAIHALRACLRFARARGIPLRSPAYHPFNPLSALRATLAADGAEERARAVHALFELGWGRGGDLGDAGAIAAALVDAGLDGAALVARSGTTEVKERLRRETDEAIARGVFGVPTFMVGEELYWGIDQLEFVELALRGDDPLRGVDIASVLPKGIGAMRKQVTGQR